MRRLEFAGGTDRDPTLDDDGTSPADTDSSSPTTGPGTDENPAGFCSPFDGTARPDRGAQENPGWVPRCPSP